MSDKFLVGLIITFAVFALKKAMTRSDKKEEECTNTNRLPPLQTVTFKEKGRQKSLWSI